MISEGSSSASSQMASKPETQIVDSEGEKQSASPASKPVTNGSGHPSSALIPEDPFSSESSKLLFDAIDQLRDCGAGKDLGLPQLVIVGKQSAGKSSLLESLTEIPFPTGMGLCTRFATRIISRRTSSGTPDMVNVSIERPDEPPFDYDEDHIETGSFYGHVGPLTPAIFKEIMEKARQKMGILTTSSGRQKNFSSLVLKIELSGARRSHFGILDVPGTFRLKTKTVTQQDMEGVNTMIRTYMKGHQNIIICVADGREDLAHQEILGFAQDEADDTRVVGVFTKCDLIDRPDSIVDIVLKKEGASGKELMHGWYVVQNRDESVDPASFDRDQEEGITFSKHPWNRIPAERRGSAKLKSFLASLLSQRIREAFPGMQREVESKLEPELCRLKEMGRPRITEGEQREYLVDIASRFRDFAIQALKAPENLPSDGMKLRAKTKAAGTKFTNDMIMNGQFHQFSNDGKRERFLANKFEPNSNLQLSLYDEIKAQIKANRGEELPGMINPAILKPLMKKQASKWPEMTKLYLDEVASLTKEAVTQILDFICKERCVSTFARAEFEKIILDFLAVGRQKAQQDLTEAWHRYSDFHLQTNNSQYMADVYESQFQRSRAAIRRYMDLFPPKSFMINIMDESSLKLAPDTWKNWAIVSEDTLLNLLSEIHPRVEENVEDEIHDILKAYYGVTLQDFMSYVDKHIVEPFLQEPGGPMMGFSTQYILNLGDDRLEELGGDDESIRKERKKTMDTIARLQAAKRIAEDTLRKTRMLAG